MFLQDQCEGLKLWEGTGGKRGEGLFLGTSLPHTMLTVELLLLWD